jgi:eukaryotic-like serine/threonine-protein kinase
MMDDPTRLTDAERAELLAAYDDHLAATGPAAPPMPSADPALDEDLACLELLDTLRPRPHAPHTSDESDDPRYELKELRGTGGVGRVWLAYDAELGRDVALKELRPERAADPAFVARFIREARITGRLQHPGVVPVYELAPQSGDEPSYYTMRLVQGRTMSEAARDYHRRRKAKETNSLDLIRLLNAFVAVCNAVAYAHTRGVIHRDLKGQNVVLGEFGEVIVLDWGFAKEEKDRPEENDDLVAPITSPGPTLQDETQAGQVLGTPAYMAPEQAAGRLDLIDRRTDVFGLGAILYEILTGDPPFTGADTRSVVQKARCGEPPPPAAVWPGVPRSLAAICARAMAREPADRFAAATDLVREVQHWLADEPTESYREGPLERLRRWGRRHQPLVAGLAALVVTATLTGGVAMVAVEGERTRAAQARAVAEGEKADTIAKAAAEKAAADERAQRLLEQRLYYHRVGLAERELDAQNLRRATELLADCPVGLRGWEWRVLDRLCRSDQTILRGHTAAVATVAYAPDGRFIASGGHDKTIRIWDATDGRELFALSGHTSVVAAIAFVGPDRLASAGWDGSVRVWDLSARAELFTVPHPGRPVHRLVHSPKANLVATVASDHIIRLWNSTDGRAVAELSGPGPHLLFSIGFSPDGRYLAAAAGDRVLIWDLTTRQEVGRLGGFETLVKYVAFSPDGRYLATGEGDLTRDDPGRVKLWEVAGWMQLATLGRHAEQVNGLAFTPDGRRLLSVSQDTTIKVWDVETRQEALTLRGHTDAVRGLAFDPAGGRLVTAGSDGTLRFWDGSPSAPGTPQFQLHALSGHRDAVFGVAFTPDGRRVVSSTNQNDLIVWDARTGTVLATHNLPESQVRGFAVAISPDGKALAAGTTDGRVFVMDAETGRKKRVLQGHQPGPIKSLAFGSNGPRLASAGWDRTVRVWDLANGDKPLTLTGHGDAVLGVAFDPDGRHIASAGFDGTVRVWDAGSGNSVKTLHGHNGRVLGVAYSRSGRLLASAGYDGTVRLWDTSTWGTVRTLKGHAAGVSGVAFGPDDHLLATCSDDWTARVWDLTTGTAVRVLRGHTDRVHAIAFHPNGTCLATAGHDRTVRIWAAPTRTPDLRRETP